MKVLITLLIAAMTLMAEAPKALTPEDREALRVAQLELSTAQQAEMQAQLALMATPQARKVLEAQEAAQAKLAALQKLVEETHKKYSADPKAYNLGPDLKWVEVRKEAKDAPAGVKAR